MAQKVEVILIDDVDGGEASETVSFSLDSVEYEIDLSDKHASEFRDAMAPWVGSARKASSRRGRSRTSSNSRPRSRADTSGIRDWAKGQGLRVSDRGRIPVDILNRYHEAHDGA